MNNNCKYFYLFGTFFFIVSMRISAQQHFTFTSNTGNNMTVLIQSSINPNIDGTLLANGDEIGIFTPSGLCAGAVVWNNANATITAWGDDEQTTTVDGINANEMLNFRVWDVSASKEFSAKVSFATGLPKYSVDGISILGSLSVQTITNIPSSVVSLKFNTVLLSVKVLDVRGKVVGHYFSAKPLFDINDLFKGGNLHNGNYVLSIESGSIKSKRIISILK
jgi:hypothetical protein